MHLEVSPTTSQKSETGNEWPGTISCCDSISSLQKQVFSLLALGQKEIFLIFVQTFLCANDSNKSYQTQQKLI
jgi:hypothetical protein